MKIETKIPYDLGGNIGKAYRYAVMTSSSEYVLMLDHDVIIMHPNWYSLCESIVSKYEDGGLFTCYASMIGSKTQLHPHSPSNDMHPHVHRKFARKLFSENGYDVTDITAKEHKTSGFFLLVKKEAFMMSGAKDGFFGVDWDLKDRIVNVGYKAYRIDGLYCYHLRDREESWIYGEKVSRDME